MKTLADAGASAVPHTATPSSIAVLWPLAPGRPIGEHTPRFGRVETTLFRVHAILVKARHVDDPPESDGKGGGDLDYHLVIADQQQPKKTMIVEFPDPHCTKGASPYWRRRMVDARSAFARACHGAPRHAFANLQGTATITGVGFFDRPHARGRALHGVELHPVVGFRSTNCRWVR